MAHATTFDLWWSSLCVYDGCHCFWKLVFIESGRCRKFLKSYIWLIYCLLYILRLNFEFIYVFCSTSFQDSWIFHRMNGMERNMYTYLPSIYRFSNAFEWPSALTNIPMVLVILSISIVLLDGTFYRIINFAIIFHSIHRNNWKFVFFFFFYFICCTAFFVAAINIKPNILQLFMRMNREEEEETKTSKLYYIFCIIQVCVSTKHLAKSTAMPSYTIFFFLLTKYARCS